MDTIDWTAKAKQERFAEIIGATQSAVSRQVTAGVLRLGGSYGDWMKAYCHHLRTLAKDRLAHHEPTLVEARARESSAKADRAEIENAEKLEQIILKSDIEPVLEALGEIVRDEVVRGASHAAAAISDRYAIELEPADLQEHFRAALSGGVLLDE